MDATFFFSLLIIIYFDISLLRKITGVDFPKVFKRPSMGVFASTFLIIAALFFSADPFYYFSAFMMLFGLSIYLIYRHRLAQFRQYTLALIPVSIHKGRTEFMSDALGVVIIWFYATFLFSIYINGFFAGILQIDSEFWEMILVTIFSSACVLVLLHRASQDISTEGFLTNLGLRKTQSALRTFIIPIIVGIIFAAASSQVILSRDEQPDTPLSEIMESADSPLAITIFIILAIFIAPFVEEVCFRGYLFKVVSLYKGQRFAIYLVALLFAFLHVDQYWGDWLAIVMVMLLGFSLTLLRVWSQSTLASMATHYTYNFGVIVMTVISLGLAHPEYFMSQGYSSTENLKEKVSLLEQSIQKDPQFAPAYYDLGLVYLEDNRDLDLAMSHIEQAIALEPEEMAYKEAKADILEARGEFEEAENLRDEIARMKQLKKSSRRGQFLN